MNTLSVKFTSFKELKSDQQKLTEALEANQGTIESNLNMIQEVFDVNQYWKTDSEETKLDSNDLEQTNTFFKSKFTHTQEGQKLCTFLSNYVLPMFSVAFTSFNQIMMSLGPKKKKKNAAETPLSKTVNQPCKELIKSYKEWLSAKIDIYSSKDVSEYHAYVDQIQSHATEYLTEIFTSGK